MKETSMPRTVLHLGAHKTATTYMQNRLALNIDLLASRGMRYDRLEDLRRNFTSILKNMEDGPNEFVRDLAAAAKVRDVLLSEENILGMPGDVVFNGVYYAKAKQRLKFVVELLGLSRPEIYLSLRDYASFTVSMYSEFIRHREFMHFDDYMKRYDQSGFSWITVMDDIVAAVPGARICIWDFGQFRSLEPVIFTRMTGFDSAQLVTPDGPARESFSEAAMRAYGALSSVLSRQELKRVIGPIARALPKGAGYEAFAPHSAETVAEMKAKYAADFAAIRAKYPAVEVIE